MEAMLKKNNLVFEHLSHFKGEITVQWLNKEHVFLKKPKLSSSGSRSPEAED